MEKTMTLNLRVNPTVKQQAEDVLKQLGIPMATAIVGCVSCSATSTDNDRILCVYSWYDVQ